MTYPKSTSTTSGRTFNANWLASLTVSKQTEFLESLDDATLVALPYLFEFWALDHQVAPEGDWRTWVILGGRGAGKTRAGAEWVRGQVEGATPLGSGRAKRMALIGETFDQVRDVMVFGDSGIMACSPPDRRPAWEATKRRLVWSNGATAAAFSASEPEGLRGPQFDAAWVDEYGCAAIDKGANEPNKFLDPKSSESSIPRYSNGHRDDFMQMQYLRAVREFWADPANNPTHQLTGVKMIDMDRAHVWAWDARPFPWFPKKRAAWGDWENYDKGHWLNGRASNRSLASVVSEICDRSGVTHYDVSRLYGLVRGYMVDQVTDARTALQPLMLAYGFEAAEREGVLEFFTRKGSPDGTLDRERFVATDEIAGDLELSRAPEAEMVGRVRLNHTEAEAGYEVRAVEAIFPDEETHSVSSSDLPMILTQPEARAITERWLAEARVARDRARFALAPSDLSWRAGDVVEIETEEGTGYFRIDHVEQAGVQMVQAVRVEPGVLKPSDGVESEIELAEFTPAVPVYPVFLDLPMLTGDEIPHLPRLAVTSDPWPGPVAVYSSASENGYALNQVIRAPARVGVTETAMRWARPGLIDNGPALRVRLPQGAVSSAGLDGILNGSNTAAIGFGDPDGWEVFQFAEAVLVEEDVYALSGRLRGQAGSDWAMLPEWPVGSTVVFLDGAVTQLSLPLSARGLERHYRIGPASETIDDETYEHSVVTTYGVGLRPYAPVHVRARVTGGDVDIHWVRRTRIDGDSWQSVDVPLGEEVESYLVRVIQSGTLRREVVVPDPMWTYTAAMQAADGVSGSFEVEVAQISQSFGPGPATRIIVEA